MTFSEAVRTLKNSCDGVLTEFTAETALEVNAALGSFDAEDVFAELEILYEDEAYGG